MGKSTRNEKLELIFIRKFHGHMLPESRRPLPYIHRDIQHPSLHHSHKLTLRIRGLLKMKSSHHITDRPAFIILDETNFPHLGAELLFRKRLHKISPLISVHLRFEEKNVFNVCLYNLHLAKLKSLTQVDESKTSSKYSLIYANKKKLLYPKKQNPRRSILQGFLVVPPGTPIKYGFERI